jgi:hypothetical protein
MLMPHNQTETIKETDHKTDLVFLERGNSSVSESTK